MNEQVNDIQTDPTAARALRFHENQEVQLDGNRCRILQIRKGRLTIRLLEPYQEVNGVIQVIQEEGK